MFTIECFQDIVKANALKRFKDSKVILYIEHKDMIENSQCKKLHILNGEHWGKNFGFDAI